MTPKQNDVYLVIQEWWKRFGYAPSLNEIMMITGDKSKSNVSRIISCLVKQGALKKHPTMKRTVRPSHMRFKDVN